MQPYTHDRKFLSLFDFDIAVKYRERHSDN